VEYLLYAVYVFAQNWLFANNSLRQTLTDTDKILLAYVGRTQVSCVNMLAPWAKWGPKWRWNGWEFFVTGTMNSHFFATVQIGMKFRQKCQSLSSI